jgi:hypothetical protein
MRYVLELAIVSDRRPKFVRRTLTARGSQTTTIRPPFDPQEFARESERATVPPPARMPSDAPEVVSSMMEVILPVDATTIPELAVAKEDLEWFDLPQLARKLLDEMDGESSVEAICERAGLVLADAIDLVEELAREGLVFARLERFSEE